MSDTSFAADFRALLTKHGINAPRFAHSARAFDPAKPQVLYSGPVFDQDELVAATTALCEGKWSVAGEYVNRFERAFSTYLGQVESVMVNSGSSADLLMIAACKARYGWKDGDGVLVSPVGFPTTISALILNNLRPVFVDIEWETLNADNDAIEAVLKGYPEDNRAAERVMSIVSPEAYRLLSKEGIEYSYWDTKTGTMGPKRFYPYRPTIRAIFLSPLLGNPPDIDRLVTLSERYGVKLLLDGCDSIGGTWRGKHLATYATASTCSFFPAHHISCIQGGMISSNDTELVALARSMGAWGKSCWCSSVGNLLPNGCCGKRLSAWLPDQPDLILDHRYVFTTDKAWNTQPLDIQGAIGLVQMGKMECIHEARRKAWTRLLFLTEEYLPDCETARMVSDTSDPSWFGFSIICPDYAYKSGLLSHLEAAGIQTRQAFGGHILRQPGYKHLGRAEDYPHADQVLRRVFFLGTNPLWRDEHFTHIESTLKSFVPPTS